MKVKAVKHILEANDEVAGKNRRRLTDAGVLGVNFISSPGSGKTTLLEKTIPALKGKKSGVIVGDLQTARDAERVSGMAVESVQINTGLSCHLYANQISEALDEFDLAGLDYLFIENVGNMVCPGEFDLGENVKVILYSFPEGDDKVAKYPTIFKVADIVLMTKADIKEHCSFDMSRINGDLKKLNDNVKVLEVSSQKGLNMDQWIEWLDSQRRERVGKPARFVSE